MKATQARRSPLEEIFDETASEDSKYFNLVHLRLLMKEREDVVNRLVELDYAIWILEEHFRTGTQE